jgi:hypothetical protein
MSREDIVLIPKPKQIKLMFAKFNINQNHYIVMNKEEKKEELFFVCNRLKNCLFHEVGLDLPILIGVSADDKKGISFVKNIDLTEGMYVIDIQEDIIYINYNSISGALYGVSTLKQLIVQFKKNLPCMYIKDYPDYKNRGLMLDISRDKIPNMKTLFNLIDLMADIKYNEFQLYIEGFSFAYPSFQAFWADQTPVTGEELMKLDKYCSERCIEFIPNHNSFGHMSPWLTRKEFNHLAECPQGFEVEYGNGHEEPGSLDPTNMESFNLLRKMYDDYLSYFSSEYFNVGCDETFELGRGKSRAECEKQGKGKVYFDFLMKIYEETKKRNKKMMFWGDIIRNHPEYIELLPKNIVALEWGYESTEPKEEYISNYQQSNIDFYVCPGTSSWNSITGRTDNMKVNILNSAVLGKKYNACGFLNTDWGDNGHWQYQPISYPGFLYGAALSWSVEENKNINIATCLDKFVFRDENEVMGKLALDIGNYYLLEDKAMSNNTYLFRILRAKLGSDKLLVENINDISLESLDSIYEYTKNLEKKLDLANMKCSDADIIYQEYKNAIRFIYASIKIGTYKLCKDEKEKQKMLSGIVDSLNRVIYNHRNVWLSRNRIGGLRRSVKTLEDIVKDCEELEVK